eukprot:gene13915-19845_t
MIPVPRTCLMQHKAGVREKSPKLRHTGGRQRSSNMIGGSTLAEWERMIQQNSLHMVSQIDDVTKVYKAAERVSKAFDKVPRPINMTPPLQFLKALPPLSAIAAARVSKALNKVAPADYMVNKRWAPCRYLTRPPLACLKLAPTCVRKRSLNVWSEGIEQGGPCRYLAPPSRASLKAKSAAARVSKALNKAAARVSKALNKAAARVSKALNKAAARVSKALNKVAPADYIDTSLACLKSLRPCANAAARVSKALNKAAARVSKALNKAAARVSKALNKAAARVSKALNKAAERVSKALNKVAPADYIDAPLACLKSLRPCANAAARVSKALNKAAARVSKALNKAAARVSKALNKAAARVSKALNKAAARVSKALNKVAPADYIDAPLACLKAAPMRKRCCPWLQGIDKLAPADYFDSSPAPSAMKLAPMRRRAQASSSGVEPKRDTSPEQLPQARRNGMLPPPTEKSPKRGTNTTQAKDKQAAQQQTLLPPVFKHMEAATESGKAADMQDIWL